MRYLVFAYGYYYPSGGANDLFEGYSYIEDAVLKAKELISLSRDVSYDCSHIYDNVEGRIIRRMKREDS